MKKFFKHLFIFIILFFSLYEKGFTKEDEVFVIKVEGAITPVTANFISYGLNYAKEKKGKALIIELDTPGGLVESTREIV
ncbi:MAG: nodulation protein NfeD, partial [Caldimicrobium sp.]